MKYWVMEDKENDVYNFINTKETAEKSNAMVSSAFVKLYSKYLKAFAKFDDKYSKDLVEAIDDNMAYVLGEDELKVLGYRLKSIDALLYAKNCVMLCDDSYILPLHSISDYEMEKIVNILTKAAKTFAAK